MSVTKPHYLLFCEGNLCQQGQNLAAERGRWRFVLEHLETGERVEATDSESISHPDRTALLAVLRGLEALEQPSRVTMITTNRYVARGLQYGLAEWRENDYCWEHFGSVQPIRNADLWKRVDATLKFHEVRCRWMSQDPAAGEGEGDAREVAVDTGLQPAEETPCSNSDTTVRDDDGTPTGAKPTAPVGLRSRPSLRKRGATRRRTIENRSVEPKANGGGANDCGANDCDASRVKSRSFSAMVIGSSDAACGALSGEAATTTCEQESRHANRFQFFVDQCRSTTIDPIMESEPGASREQAQQTAMISSSGLEETVSESFRSPEELARGPLELPRTSPMPSLIRDARPLLFLLFPFRWIWGTILSLDAFLVACLRCMFLLDPRRDQFKPRKF